MASNSKSTETVRYNKKSKSGRNRKRAVTKLGTTRSEAELFGNTLKR